MIKYRLFKTFQSELLEEILLMTTIKIKISLLNQNKSICKFLTFPEQLRNGC
jgi:hypothetical protein